MTRFSWARLVILIVTLAAVQVPASAQQLGIPNAPILTINSERLFTDSAFGQRVAREVEAESAILVAENNRIEAELTAEEKALTEQRPDMEPDAFRALADAFDAKVSEIRRTQDQKARELVGRNEDAQIAFLQAVRPVLGTLMRESGASVILERSSVFLSANATDVTDVAIDRINAAIGDGHAIEKPSPNGDAQDGKGQKPDADSNVDPQDGTTPDTGGAGD